MAAAAIIATLVNVGTQGSEATHQFVQNFVNSTNFKIKLAIFQKNVYPYMSDEDLINFMKTGIARFKNDKGDYYTVDTNETIAFLAATDGAIERMQALQANGYTPTTSMSSMSSTISKTSSWFSKYWPWLLLGFAVFYLLTKKKRRKK